MKETKRHYSPFLHFLGTGSTALVLGCNCWWTFRILIGAKKIIWKAFSRKQRESSQTKSEDNIHENGGGNGYNIPSQEETILKEKKTI